MASQPDEDRVLQAALGDLSGLDVPAALSVDDLGRLSMESFAEARTLGRRSRSAGAVRLFGPAVRGNAAPLDAAGQVMVAMQKLVMAVGAGISEVHTSRGQLPTWVRERTSLTLLPAMAPGSLIFRIEAAQAPEEELSPRGEVSIDEGDPLIDLAFTGALALIDAPRQDRLRTSALGVQLQELGPRVAGNLRTLADVLASAALNIDVRWAAPTSPTRVAELNYADAERLRRFVDEGSLDEWEITFNGELRTISDRRMWEVQDTAGDIIRLDVSELPPSIVREFRVGDPVSVLALWSVENLPGGGERNHYVAMAVDRPGVRRPDSLE